MRCPPDLSRPRSGAVGHHSVIGRHRPAPGGDAAVAGVHGKQKAIAVTTSRHASARRTRSSSKQAVSGPIHSPSPTKLISQCRHAPTPWATSYPSTVLRGPCKALGFPRVGPLLTTTRPMAKRYCQRRSAASVCCVRSSAWRRDHLRDRGRGRRRRDGEVVQGQDAGAAAQDGLRRASGTHGGPASRASASDRGQGLALS